VINDFKNHDPSENLYYYDEWGWWVNWGYGDQDSAWAMIEITPTRTERIHAVDFWAVNSTTDVGIWIYDSYSGGTLDSLLYTNGMGTIYAGYFSLEISSPILVTKGDPIYVVARFETPGYNYPIPADDSGPISGKCYISRDGSNWVQSSLADFGVRVRTWPPLTIDCSLDGDPAFYVGWGEATRDVIAGEVITYTLGPTNFGFVSGTCPGTDTFCMEVTDTKGWSIVGDPAFGECYLLDPGYLWWNDVTITVPCDVSVGDADTITAVMDYCNDALVCRPECGDCEDPNDYSGSPFYSTVTLILNVVESPPALYVEQDSITYVEQGQTAAYVPFSICNGDACAPPSDYVYNITSLGHVGSALNVTDTLKAVNGGECGTVYGVIDAGSASVCDYDTLTIIAWSVASPGSSMWLSLYRYRCSLLRLLLCSCWRWCLPPPCS